ncbi:hypothetical protein G3O08_04610 [Cryomorpha ignava]|uniref:Homing endonuclease PI-Sce domain-containing protein n=1 Tax=Cryomorpha ignava TaxID=101383 RepID=A0A7K3WP20_9FLAO|nr:hypothetical protein [Cryomorpha ignava]NEN22781.1 hypothetical protein [Cryomorpha ignava]
MEITISGKDKNLLRQVEKLAKKLGLNISKTEEEVNREEQKVRSEKLYLLMVEMATSGAFSTIKDPISWQREQRKDKPLPGREES